MALNVYYISARFIRNIEVELKSLNRRNDRIFDSTLYMVLRIYFPGMY